MATSHCGTVVSIGTFDGVHLGHQAILRHVHREATQRGLESIAYAFDAPPRWVQAGEPSRTLLLPRSVKRILLEQHVDRAIPVALADVRQLSPEAFAETILRTQLDARLVVVGETFRFGLGRAGTVAMLETLGTQFGFDVSALPPVELDGAPVSSTRIRRLISSGRVEEARRLLGRPALLIGEVEAGGRLGRQLGYPTANLEVDEHDLLPGEGIYFVHAFVEKDRYDALLYVGRRPTLGEGSLRCAAHLLAPRPLDLYGLRLEIHVLERIRSDCAFESLEALRRQIGEDVAEARIRSPRHSEPTAPFAS